MDHYIQLLYQALTSPLGIIVLHDNPISAKSTFYAKRKKHGDPALDAITIKLLEDQPDRLYLVNTCPEEKTNPLSVSTSGSSSPTPSGSETISERALESPEPSET